MLVCTATAQPAAFTYQGRLTENGAPASGSNDLRFVLFDDPSAGNQISTNATFDDVLLTNGLFTVVLDWGAGVFDGSERWLEVRVRPGNAGGSYTTLSPRQRLTSAPYALHSGSASNLLGFVADAQLSANVSLLGQNIDSSEIVNGSIVNADINASAAIADSKLATISTAGKVANSATTAASANTANAIVTRDANGGFAAGDITAQRINVGSNHQLTGNLASIGAGNGNTNHALRAFIAGGLNNFIQTNAGGSFIGGGQANVVQSNTASAFVGGGEANSAASDRAFIGAGQGNSIATNAGWAVIPGGRDNTVAGDYSLAAGRRAKANHSGTFAWADGQNADFASATANTFIVRAQNGVGINTNDPAGVALNVNGSVRAGSFEGSLAAANLTGTVADARLSANVSLLGNNIDSTEIVNGTIMNVDINAAANIADTKLATINEPGKVANSATTATSANTPDTIVQRDGAGNFSAGTITGSFVGSGAGLTNVSLLTAAPSWAITLTTNAGTFGFALASAPLVGQSPYAIVSADFNGDGRPDLATVNSTFGMPTGTVSVLTNNGNGFSPAGTPNVGPEPTSLVAADVNGDGKVDLVTSSTHGSLSILTNAGNAVFGLASSPAVSGSPRSVVAAEANRDGKIDLVVSSYFATLDVLTNAGSGTFAAASTPDVRRDTSAMAVADVNGDGTADILCANSDVHDYMTVMLGTGTGNFVWHSTNAVGNGPNSPNCIVAADINGDGKPDAVCANSLDDTLSVFTNNGGGTFTLKATVFTGDHPEAVHAADVNGDGKVDLITANLGADALSVLTNNGSGGFGLAASPVVGTFPGAVVAVDVNGDGSLDLCAANRTDDTVTILLNSPSSVSTSATFQGNFSGAALTVNGTLTAATLLSLGQSSFSAASGSTLTPATSHVQVFPDVNAAVTLDAATAIANGKAVGQVLILKGAGVFTVTVPDNANTQLQANRALGSGDTLFLVWDGSDWIEVSYSNN